MCASTISPTSFSSAVNTAGPVGARHARHLSNAGLRLYPICVAHRVQYVLKAASHCPEIDSRWKPQYEILKILVLFICIYIFFNFTYKYKYIWVSIRSQLQDSVMPALGDDLQENCHIQTD